ncbi:MAG: peptidoglycan bridge formation glycyltransferase FemA/FemB family protein, partial [Candidatus Bilamarchaeaceae archaeon]
LTRHSILEGFSLFLTKRVVPFVYWLDGPICSEGKMGPIIDQLDLYCKKRGFVVKNAVLPTIAASLEEKLREMHFQIRKNSTFIVDLNKTEDEAFSSLTKKARWAVRKAQEKGVVVRLAEDDDLEDYYELLISWKKSIGLSTYISYQQLKKQWQLLHPENMQVFLAYWNRKLVAAMGLLYFNGNMIEVMSAQSDVNKQNKLFAGDILKWSIIRWGIKNSMKTYDLAGVNPRPDATEKEKAIYQFKSKWGGLLTEKLVLTKNYSHLPFIK